MLGRGGMGAVYAGVQLSVERPVAIKVLHRPPGGGDDSRARQRFVVEAKAVARLEHVNGVRLYDFGTTPDGLAYLVMELLEGLSLADYVVASGGTLPIPEAVRIVAAAANGLASAHRRGIVHRDIKPANIHIGPAPGREVKVIDFGLAIGDDPTGRRITAAGLLVGTPAWMSPEQAEGAPEFTPACDVYSLGLTLFRLVVGHNPFTRDDLVESVLAHLNAPVPAVDWVPAALADIWETALAKWPEDRYPDGAALRDALYALDVADAPTAPGPKAPFAGAAGGAARPGAAGGAARPGDADADVGHRRRLELTATATSAVHLAPFVGRAALLDALLDDIQRALWSAHAMSRAIVGPPGIGRSRLLAEIQPGVDPDATCVRIVAPPADDGPYGLARALLAALPDPEALLEGVESDPAWIASAARQLVGLEPVASSAPELVRIAGTAALAAILRAVAADSGLVVLIDDYDDADDASVAILNHVRPELERFPFALLAAGELADARRVELKPLDFGPSRALIRHFIGEEQEAGPAVQRMTRLADGNPLFLIELARSGDSNRLPGTLQDLIEVRVAALDPEERAFLDEVAVAGRRFPAALAPDRPAVLARLIDDGVVVEETAGLRFATPLFREVIYRALPARRRRDGHLKIARWLRDHGGSATLVATHFEGAEQTAEAAEAWAEAGERARRRSANAMVARAFEKALSHDPRPEWRLELGMARLMTGAIDAARGLLVEAMQSPLPPTARIRGLRYLARAAGLTGDADARLDYLEQAAAEEGDPAELLQVAVDFAFARLGGEADDAVARDIDDALAWAAATPGVEAATVPVGNLWLVKAILLTNQGALPAAADAAETSRRTFCDARYPVGEATAHNSLSVVERGRGRYEQAIAAGERAARGFGSTGHPIYRVTALLNIARARLEQGEALAARSVLRGMRVEHEAHLSPVNLGFADVEEALAAAALGQTVEARQLADRAQAAADATGVPDLVGRALHTRGVVRSEPALLEGAAAHWRALTRPLELHATLCAWLALDASADAIRAERDALRTTLNWVERA